MTETGRRVILVTGASGFIGRHALHHLLEKGFEVHGVSRSKAPDDMPAGVRWHAADLLLPNGARKLMEKVKPTHVLHFAWTTEHGKFWDSALNLAWLAATLVLLEEFQKSGGKRFVGAGTCAEYDWTCTLFDETKTPLHPASLYGKTKASAYAQGLEFSRAKNFSFAWGRIFNLFGPGEPPARIVPALIRAHLTGQSLNCSHGTQTRDFLPVTSVADAFAHLCAGEAIGAFNIGSGHGLTLRDLSEKIAQLANRRGDIRFGALPDTGPEKLLPVLDRIILEIGWRPPDSIDAGLGEAINGWMEPPGSRGI